jgi:ferredoxin-NADP reductase
VSWDGEKTLRVTRRTPECDGVVSLTLAADDGAPLPPFKAGQYLTFSLDVPQSERPVIRCYSLSDAPGDTYRITVKRVGKGLASTHLSVALEAGDTLQVRGPQGQFVLDPGDRGPRIFLAGGIGITPLLAMLNHLARQGGDGLPLTLYLGVRNGREHPFKSHLEALAREHDWFDLQVAYSRPDDSDREGVDYQHRGRVTTELLKRTLAPADDPQSFYVCGPAAMMDALIHGLEDAGVPRSRIRLEAFGGAAVKPFTRRLKKRLKASGDVTFARAGKTVPWDPEATSLLDLALANEVFFPFACAAGHCGTCATSILAGKVVYGIPPQFPLAEGRCLPCIGVPDGPLTLDL